MEKEFTDSGRKLLREFEREVAVRITNMGIWPLPMFVATGRTEVVDLKCSDPKAYEVFCRACSHPDVTAAVFGLDRHSSDPSTEFKDVLTCILYEKSQNHVLHLLTRVRNQFRFGIITYHHKPRAVRPIDWTNNFWNAQMQLELYSYIPDVVITEEGLARIY